MSYINKTISIYGTEKEFIKAFVNELTKADSRIICETDIDAEFANEDTSHIITVVLSVNDCYKLNLARSAAKNSNTSIWYISQEINGIVTIGTRMYFTSGNSAGIDTLITRSWKAIVISNDNAIAMIFGSYNSSAFPSSYSYNVFSYHEQDFNVVSLMSNESTATKSALEVTLLRTDEGSEGESYTISNRLPYARSGENVEIIESKVLFNNSVAEHDMKNVFDCSNVSEKNILSFENNKYYALNSNTLVLI